MLAILGQASLRQAEVVCTEGSPLSSVLREMGVKTHNLEFNKYAFPRRLDWHFAFYRRFRRILAHSHPEVVVMNLDSNTPHLTFACLRSRIPIVRYSRFEFRPPRRWLDRYCWLRCAAVICPSDHVRRQVTSWDPQQFRARVHHLYDPHVHADISESIKNELKLHGVRTIGYVGRLHPPKRIETLIQAVAEIRSKGGNFHLLIIGGHDGSYAGAAYETQLRELTAALALNDIVKFLGYRKDVLAVMAACDVIVLPSETESLGMVLLEAWSLKVPTVASDVAGCREVSLASGGGLLCPVGNHFRMAVLIRDLIMQPQLSHKLGASGQAWVKANCDPGVYADRFCALLASLGKQIGSDPYGN